jgi:hypothetical protein
MPRIYSKIAAWVLLASGVLFLASLGYGQAFTVTATPSSLTIYPGEQNIPLAVTVGNSSYTGPITVTLTGLPSGITVTPLTLAGGGTGNLVINASIFAGNEGFYEGFNANWTATVTVVAAAGSTQATSQLSLTVSISNPSFAPAASAINLPIVKIDTGGVGIVDKTTDVSGTITITSADGQTSYLPSSSNSDNTATFHVHGNTTAGMPKLPYKVKLNTKADLLGAMGLSCPYVTSKSKAICDKSKSYILLANYDDKTLLRDWSAFALANAIPNGNGYLSSPSGSPTPSGTSTIMPWAPHSLFVELYLNGVYEGNYQLVEQIKVDSNRVSINELSETDIADDITGGYLLEIDQHRDEAFVFTTPQGLPIGLDDPDFTPDAEVPEQTTYISNYVGAAETALYSSNFTDSSQGWRAYFDEASAINFYIVNDLMGNNDGGAFFSSDYLYKTKDNPLLYLGPVWDFDISSGNVSYNSIMNPTVPWMQINASWYVQWFKDSGFKEDVVKQWNALKNNGVFSTWISSIQQKANALEKSQANNFGRWPMLGIEVWPNAEAVGSYDGEVAYLTNWLQLRLSYLDSLFNNKAQTVTTLNVSAASLYSGTAISLTAQVTVGTSPTGTVSFLSNGILLGTGALSDGLATLTISNLPVGTDLVQAVYNGDDTNGLSASTSQSVIVKSALAATVISLTGASTIPFGTLDSFTALVIPNSGTAVPTGTVTFAMDGGSGTTMALDGTGLASYSNSSLAAGTHAITATYSGDISYSAASSLILQIQVAQATPTITWPAPAVIPYGTALSATQLNASSTVAGSFVYTPAAGTMEAAGQHTLSVAFTPDDKEDYTAATAQVTLTVNQSTPALTITSSANPVLVANPTTFTAAVSSGASTPTGTVNFMDGATLLGQGTLSSGVATLTTSSLAAGTHTITVAYQGDTNFIAVISGGLGQSVLDFSLSSSSGSGGSSPSQTVLPGGTATYSLALVPTTGVVLPTPVTLTMSGLPTGATVTINPSSWTELTGTSWSLPSNTPLTNVTMSIHLPQSSSALQRKSMPIRQVPPMILGILLLPLAGRLRRRGKKLGRVMCMLLLWTAGAAAMAGLTGCGSTSGYFGQKQQTYTIMVTATSGSLSHTTSVTLTVE